MKKLFLDVCLLFREVIASILFKNFIINLFLLPFVILSIFYSHKILLGALLGVLATINIIETYKSIEKEKFWQKRRCFYYLLYFEQLVFITDELKDLGLTTLYLTAYDRQGRPYISIEKDTYKKINQVIYELGKYIDEIPDKEKFLKFFNKTKKYFIRIIEDAIQNIELYSTREEILDKVLESKEFIILLNQVSDDKNQAIGQNQIKQLITFLEISKKVFNSTKLELFLNRYKHVRIGQKLLIEGSNEEGAHNFKSIEYTFNDFWQETLYKIQRWCCRNIC